MPPLDRKTVLIALAGVAAIAYAVRAGSIQETQLLFFAALVPSIILHEVSHGAVALVFGDDTAQQEGRLSLNPFRHVDPFGTVVLPAILVMSGGAAFGYAKPVPVNPRRMRDPRNHSLLTSLAGPATNIALAVLSVVLIQMFDLQPFVFTDAGLFDSFVGVFGLANVYLAVFNLIPLPPLDGSAVIERVMPATWWPRWMQIRQYSMIGLFALVMLAPQLLSRLFDPAVELWARLAF